MAVSIGAHYSNGTADPGDWYVFQEDPVTGERSRMRLRPLTDVEEQAISVESTGATVRLKSAGEGGVEQDWSAIRFRQQQRRRACLALLATDGVAVTPADEVSAKAYAAFVGTDVQVGAMLVLDSHLDKRAMATIDDGVTDQGAPRRVTREMSLREFFLAGPHAAAICDWIMATVAEKAKIAGVVEAGKART